jgi:hypothetical protein
MTPADWQIAAYEAALRQDHDAVVASLQQLKSSGRAAIEQALHAWMERTKVAMFTLAQKVSEPVEFAVEAEADEYGRVRVDPETAWAGQLFACHVSHDHDQWDTLFTAVPDGDELDSAVLVALTVLAATATDVNTKFIETVNDGLTPAVRSARLARAHLN